MSDSRRVLTSPGGPVVLSDRTLRALASIRRLGLLEKVYGDLVMARSVFDAAGDVLNPKPAWLTVLGDRPDTELPSRIAGAGPLESATLKLAIAIPASIVLIDGPIKEPAKLSFIKCEGTVSILVQAYREGHLSAVRPMVKALRALGHEDVLPPPEALEALWTALDQLR